MTDTVPERLAPGPTLRQLVTVHGVVSIVCGALLIFLPGRTLTLVAVIAGLTLCVAGVLQLFVAFRHGLTGPGRAAALLLAPLCILVGAVVIAHPQSSVKLVAVLIGVALWLRGLLTLVFGVVQTPRWLRGSLELIAGTVLIFWPEITIGVIAIVYGIALVALGAMELLVTRRTSASASG